MIKDSEILKVPKLTEDVNKFIEKGGKGRHTIMSAFSIYCLAEPLKLLSLLRSFRIRGVFTDQHGDITEIFG